MQVLPDRIIVTESEETYYTIKVVTGTKQVLSTIEMSAIDKILNDKSWTREQYMYDIPKLDDRIYFAGVLQEMVNIINQYNGEVVQIVYETDDDKIKEILGLGYIHIICEKSKMRYYIKEIEPITVIQDESPKYENISNDAEHVEKFIEFHTQKIMTGQLKHSDDLLVNIDDVVVFLGFSGKSEMVYTFKKNNYISNLEYFVLNTEEEINDMEKMDCFVSEDYKSTNVILVINEMILDQLTSLDSDVIWNKVSLVVCDTNMERESTILLSLCKRKHVTHVKKIQYGSWFNFGVFNKYQQCSPMEDNAKNAVITFTEDVWIDKRSFVAFVDPRYANIFRIASAMELSPDVWSISIIHDVFDDVNRNCYEYKFMPYYQSDQIVQLCNVMRKGLFHTPLSVYTKFPAIAKMLFESSIFVSCDKDHFKQYVDNVNEVFVGKIKGSFEKHLDFINTAKKIACDRQKKIDLVKEAYEKSIKKKLNHEIVFGKQEKLLAKTLEKLKI